MYRLLIADDERYIRENLTTLIHWEELGFTVVGSAQNGREVISMLPTALPDVVLTDIKMPLATGLDVARHIQTQKLGIRVVLLSGYKEFELARAAANYGVHCYMLKPTRLEDVYQTFRTLKAELDEERRNTEAQQQIMRAYSDSLQALRGQTLHDLLYLSDPEGVLERLAKLHLPIFLPKFCLVLMDLPELEVQLQALWHYERDLFDTLLQNVIRAAQGSAHVEPFTLDARHLLLVINAQTDEDTGAFVRRFSDELHSLINLRFDLRVGERFSDPAQLRQMLTQLDPALLAAIGPEQESMLVTVLIEGNRERLTLLLHALLRDVSDADIPACLVRLQTHILGALRELGYDNARKALPRTQEEMRVWLLETMDDWLQWKKHHDTAEQRLVRQMTAFIEKHLGEDLSLKRVADEVHMSPAYVSRLFKQATGENFIDLLKRLRVDRACQMLGDPEMRIYEIATATGYRSDKHFMKVFREYKGMTPGEFRRQAQVGV